MHCQNNLKPLIMTQEMKNRPEELAQNATPATVPTTAPAPADNAKKPAAEGTPLPSSTDTKTAPEEQAAETVATVSASDDGSLEVGEMKMYTEIIEGLMAQLEDRFKDTLRAELVQITAPIEKARQEAYTAGRNDAIAETWDKPLPATDAPATTGLKPLFGRRKSVWE